MNERPIAWQLALLSPQARVLWGEASREQGDKLKGLGFQLDSGLVRDHLPHGGTSMPPYRRLSDMTLIASRFRG